MATTTANKKEIVDFLWEWAESHGDWSKILIDIIAKTETNLQDAQRKNVFDYFLQSIGFHSGLTSSTIVKPTYVPTSKQIELTSLSDITGVNRLAKNQIINFSKNLTVIYGENGTGKTGYERILKALGFSYDHGNVIHTNIYGKPEAKSAVIKFKSNGVDETFNWDGKNTNSELENISVFNNSCVQISLSDRQLLVSPIGFHLFNLVTTELNELSKLLQTKIASYPTTLNCIDTLNVGTPQQTFVKGLSETSTEKKLNEILTFTSMHEQELKDKETELSNLNKTLLQTEINNLTSQATELETLITKIQTAETIFSATNWQLLIDYNKQIKYLESKTQTGIKDIAETNGIEFYETKEFQSFITAAENYIKIINKPDYPNEEDLCVYCKQPLEESAKELLASYRTLLNDKTQENLEQLKQKKANLIEQISQVEINLIFHQPTFGSGSDQKPNQPIEITEYNKNLGSLKTTFTTDKILDGCVFNFDYSTYIKFLVDKKTSINSVINQKSSDFRVLQQKNFN